MTTVTVDFAETPLPAASCAENVTVVVPSGNTGGASLVAFSWPETMSLAVDPFRKAAMVESVVATVDPPWEDTVIGAGTVSTGGVVSTTSTEKEAELAFE